MRTAILMALLLLLSACASPSGGGSGATSADQAEASRSSATAVGPTMPGDASAAAATETLTGVLGGDPDLEGGCVWLETGDGRRVEVVWPEGYRASVEPVRLRDATGDVVAAEGDAVTVEGAPAREGVSTCQIGEIWTASAIDAPASR
jgi:hypothetical protein